MIDRKEKDITEIIEGFKHLMEGYKVIGINYIYNSSAKESLDMIRKDLGDCKRCILHKTRKNIVFGEGNEKAFLMFVGEAPGAEEDIKGRPFVGKAGELLERIITKGLNMQRKDVYIGNIVKCRPPNNRTPLAEEIKSCFPFLVRQILSIRPKIIVALGNVAAQTLLGTKETITQLRGHFFTFKGIKVMPTYHPAYLLRNEDKKRECWEDLKKVKKELML
ncbi:MAG: uracil-DNA glycosylase [Thermoplasmata archaeon]|nr:MAG: uracil-DNA glycosylase [Thermoplasmata archaeon]